MRMIKLLWIATFLCLSTARADEVWPKSPEEERAIILSPKICVSIPNGVRKDSTNEGAMGIGGPKGKSCAPKELYWVSADRFAAMCFKGPSGKPQYLGQGMAAFSPDCAWFWSSRYEGLSVHDAANGKIKHTVTGDSPTWLPASDAILFEWTKGSRAAIKRLDVRSGKESVLTQVNDYKYCTPMGEGVDFRPPELVGERIVWTYPTSAKPPADLKITVGTADYFPGYKAGKKLTLNLKTGKIEKTEWVQMECDPD